MHKQIFLAKEGKICIFKKDFMDKYCFTYFLYSIYMLHIENKDQRDCQWSEIQVTRVDVYTYIFF